MRLNILSFFLVLSLFCGMLLQGLGCSKSSPTSPTSGVWLEATANAAWAPRYGMGGAVFNGSMWVIGGASGPVTTYYGDVYSSSNGTTWNKNVSSAPFGARYTPGVLSFNGKLWVIGGNKSGTFMNDVWSSPDGNTWTQVTASAAFTAREDFCVAVLNGNMIVIGGWTGTTKGDIWSSADGITWNQITPAVSPLPGNTLGFLPRWGSADTIFNGLIWIWGGANGDPNPAHDIPLSGLNDEWTFDGTSLIQINDNSVNDGLVYHQFTANNGHLWLTPGSTPGYPSTPGYYNSADGNNWTAYPTYYQPRSGHLALSYNNSLWVMGGYYSGCWEPSGCAVTYYNDVWHNP